MARGIVPLNQSLNEDTPHVHGQCRYRYKPLACLFNSHYYVNKIENMRTNDSKTSVDSKLEEMEEKYPVEQIAVKNEKKITAKDVKEAVKEINPDTDSLGSRG